MAGYVGVGQHNEKARGSLLGAHMMKVYASIAFAFALMFGVLLLGRQQDYKSVAVPAVPRSEGFSDTHNRVFQYLQAAIDPENIQNNLRKLTQEPHLAGTEANKRVAETVARMWLDAGLEGVHTIPYEVLLSYPVFDRPNRVFIRDPQGKEVFSTTGRSPVLYPDEQGAKHAGHQWLAWSSPGVSTGDIVYANRGAPRDFSRLRVEGVNITGKIVIMRYGEGFRGDKVYAAQQHGAIGAILFSDPDDVARDGPERVYPKTFWMPPEGVQRGSIIHVDGDPLSPLYPAKKGMFRTRTLVDAKREGILPSIPAIPVSYSTAYELLSRMKGTVAPPEWHGGINVTHRFGPGMINDEKVKIEVHCVYQTKQIRNVVGYIKGADEPDRYVILGNHYDAWVYGSMDPNSGTAILSEVARAMVETVNNTKWRPARTIMFAAWDAEEYGLIGSTEFVEEFTDILQQRAVVYLNMDCLMGNTSIGVNTVPSVYKATMDVAKRIKNPNKEERAKGRETLFDTWANTFPSSIWSHPDFPLPGGGSDMAAFLNYAGVPVVDFSFKNTTTRDTYPLYHTLYETPYLNEHLLDTDGFSIHKATAQYWAELARTFADEVVIPLNSSEFALTMSKEYLPMLQHSIEEMEKFKESKPAIEQFNNLVSATEDFLSAAKKFESTKTITRFAFSQNPYNLRNVNAVNERIMGVERCFINPRGIPGAPHSRHVLFSLSDKDSYSAAVMAAVYDLVEDFIDSETHEKRGEIAKKVAQQLSIVQHSVNCAISTLHDHI